jgi:hypothetical protein
MVDRQTPTVEADAETEREAEAVREGDGSAARPAEAEREVAPERIASANREAPAEPGRAAGPAASAGAGTDANAALFDRDAANDFQQRWINIQTEFVDEPGAAVEQAEALVGEVMTQLTESFARERRDLQARWSGHDDVSTEDLRQAIRRYRSFFNRLLSV